MSQKTTEITEETTVVEATGTEPVQKTEQPAGGNRSRKKNRKKNRTNRNQNRAQEAKKEAPAPEEIWMMRKISMKKWQSFTSRDLELWRSRTSLESVLVKPR